MAYGFYITIQGRKQGAFKGRISGIRYLAESTSPRDEATGQASGKRTHKPITITKEWDASSPQLFQALVDNEILASVLLEFVKADPTGKEAVYHSVKLTNASVASIRSYLDLTDTSGDRFDAHELEDISFVFQKIELENKDGKTTAADTWQT